MILMTSNEANPEWREEGNGNIEVQFGFNIQGCGDIFSG
jgi:hypothetical protein